MQHSELKIIEKNILQCIDSCCFIYKFNEEDKNYLTHSAYKMLIRDCSNEELLSFNWPDKFFNEFISELLNQDLFYKKLIGRQKANKFFILTKTNGLEYCVSRLVYAVKTNTPVDNIVITMNTSNPNPNKTSYFVGTNAPNKGATGIPYLEAKRQQWIKRDVNEMSFGIHKRKKRAKSGK